MKTGAWKRVIPRDLARNRARFCRGHLGRGADSIGDGQHNEKLALLVQKLEDELAEAIDRKANAIARAQLTRSGHVYILSNIGTMGPEVFKIGMTRRLEPLERVKERGGKVVF